jgi:hypothetical protein
MCPVFIIGFSRTGSSLLQHILHNYTPISIAPEMHLLWPRRLHRDFAWSLRNQFGEVDSDEKVDRLIEFMFSKRPIGAFWQVIDKMHLDVNTLRRRILVSDRSVRSIFDALISGLAESCHKEIMGAKFPVHYSYVNKLLEWYPNCRLIHTIRDPRAIFASQFHKRAKGNGRIMMRLWVGILQFVHVDVSFNGVVRMHQKLKNLSNYYLYRYEDAVARPEDSLRQLCGFLSVPFTQEMLTPRVRYNSSYGKIQISKGFHRSSVDAWQKKLPKSVAGMIRFLNAAAMRKVGYF